MIKHNTVLVGAVSYLMGRAIRGVLEDLEGFEVLEEISDARKLEFALQAARPNILVLDATPDFEAAFHQLASNGQVPKSSVLVFSHATDRQGIQALVRSGAIGVLTPACGEAEIRNAILAVSEGRRFYCDSILQVLTAPESTASVDADSSPLSGRELEVLQLIVDGLTTKEIAHQLNLSVHTVNSHRKSMLKKLHLHSPAQLITHAVQVGLATLRDK